MKQYDIPRIQIGTVLHDSAFNGRDMIVYRIDQVKGIVTYPTNVWVLYMSSGGYSRIAVLKERDLMMERIQFLDEKYI